MKNNVSSCVKTNLATLVYLSIPTNYTRVVYANADASLRKALSECGYNALYGNIEFTDEERQILRDYTKELIDLSNGKKINPSLLPKLLPPILVYVCEGTVGKDVRALRGDVTERPTGSGDEGVKQGEANSGLK